MTIRKPGPESRWVRLTEHEVGRPHFRPKRNPVTPAGTASASGAIMPFPYQAVTSDGQSLELVRWSLRDIFSALVATVLQAQQLFVVGNGQPFTPQGGTTAKNKTFLEANIQTQNGVLPNPQSFLVSSIRQIIRASIAVIDMVNWMYSTLGQLQCGDLNRIYFQAAMAEVTSAQTVPFVGAVGSVYTGALLGAGWPTVHNQYSMSTGLMDPNIGAIDQGVVINQGRQFNFLIDPTQDALLYTAGWTTQNGTNQAGSGLEIEIVLDGVLARSLAG